MGIPKFFRWLTRRYPLILQNLKRGEDCPPIDNLYLDLNGIVHNCIHGNDAKRHERISLLTDFEEVWVQIMLAIDELVHTVKPKQLLFLAVDGVAPRAKMNQQRARRFRSAKDAIALKESLKSQGKEGPDLFDSNAISPGTTFMNQLNQQLAFFIQYKLNTDAAYQKLKEVVVSDGTVPGEGEHKMMDYIRQLKLQEGYDPNTRHCFYGADADLIMLSLITHEPHFTIIREEHIVKKIKQGGVQRIDMQRTSNFQLLHISLLREYFQLEYKDFAGRMKFPFNLERIIDDFAFFCFFIGNDFLPSLTTLDIGEGALDTLIDFYKSCLSDGLLTDYITDSGSIFWDRAEPFIKLLGKHEHDTFIDRIDHLNHQRAEGKIISFDQDFGVQGAKLDRNALLQKKIKEKLYYKKVKKIDHLNKKPNGARKYKKFLLIKRYDEDDDQIKTSKSKPQQSQEQKLKKRADLFIKYSNLRSKNSSTQSEGEANQQKEEEKKQETLADVLNSIHEEFFSELDPDDIPDSEVSDIDEEELNIEEVPMNGGQVEGQSIEMDAKIQVQSKMTEKYQEENYEFMLNFVKIYAEDKNKAKAHYYLTKVKIDTSTEQGQEQMKTMLKKYLEGLQWVLFYYYRGAQHWRWYYPYHYAPMISDLGSNIVQNFLGGQVNINTFEIDANCSQENYPYTPFQQLLSILPIRSMKLMPDLYAQIILGELNKYFPLDFDLDLNGRTLPWEAACLIPFVDEQLFLNAEKEVLSKEKFTEEEGLRNTIHFTYYSYKYNQNKQNVLPLTSTLTNFKHLELNYVQKTVQQDYQNVGKYSFAPTIHPGAVLPSVDSPSFKWLNATEIEYDYKVFNKVQFKRLLIKIPKSDEETKDELLEAYVHHFLKQNVRELYMDYPYCLEAFPTVFENAKHTYTLYGDVYSGFFKIHKEEQKSSADQYQSRKKRIQYRLQDKGLLLPECFDVIVSISQFTSIQFNSSTKAFYKVYDNDCAILPLCVLMKKRDPAHYLNVNALIQNPASALKQHSQIVCLNQTLFGVMGTIDLVDYQSGTAKIVFNKKKEESKIHDPFIGHNCLAAQMSAPKNTLKKYFYDKVIESQLKLKFGVVNRLTGSVLLTFNDPESGEVQVVDLGLNLKNWTKQVHIPDFVRYVNSEQVADNQHDHYTHNTHARGAKHVRKQFEYSEECVQIIKNYYMLFPEVFEFITKEIKKQDHRKGHHSKPLNTLRDVFGQMEQNEAVKKVKVILSWIEALPISKLPYVELGFNALAHDLIQKLDNEVINVKENYQSIQLKCKPFEYLKVEQIYQESYPYWASPFTPKTPLDFEIGDRVMNINSTQREYIPFGLRGTVAGRTNDKVIVIFDEQFLQGSTIQEHCQSYRGALVNSLFLLNLTRKFNSIMKKNMNLIYAFTEQEISNQPPRQVTYQPIVKAQSHPGPQQNQTQQQPSAGQSQNYNDMLENLIAQSQPQPLPKHKMNQETKIYRVKSHPTPQATEGGQVEVKQVEPIQEEIKQEESKQEVEEVKVEQEEQFGLVPTQQYLQSNPDFQQLMGLLQLAEQMKMPLPSGAQSEGGSEEGKPPLDVNANAFVPSWKKQ